MGSDVYEYFERDAFGNASFHHSFPRFYGPDDVPGSAFANTHPAQKGGQMTVSQEEWTFDTSPNQPSNWDPGWKTFTSDSDTGHRIAAGSESYTWQFSGGTEGYDTADKQAEHRSYSRSYYSADGKLMVHQINRDSLDYRYYNPPQDTTIFYGKPWGAYEEYWYDALGRRVLKRSRRESPICTHLDRCYSSIERFVWDGDQILWELRQSGAGDTKDPSGSAYTGQTGNVGYVHAAGIDAPLGMVRNGNTVILRRNWRGLYVSAKDASGSNVATDVPWPGVNWAVRQDPVDPREDHTWVGSLPMGQQDHTGLNYRRNRYYDPNSGQFTQQDPIGIAGGLNLYGYANGDPVNFSDPFGLCVEDDETCEELVAFLRGFDNEVLSDAATRLEKYQGRVFLQDGPFSGSTSADRMILSTGASMEMHPDGSSGLVTPGRGDLAVLLAHETLHLGEDGSFFASDGETRTGLSHPPYGPFEAREKAAYMGLNKFNPQAPLSRLRFSVYGMLTPVRRGR